MPKFKVIKAHDGVQEGTIKSLPVSSITKYMVANGWWEEVIEAEDMTTAPKVKRNTSRKATTAKK